MARTRMQVDERRAQLLELGARLFATHAYDELTMARIAREAGISKPLLYHYFPSKQDYFQATLMEAAEDLRRRTQPDSELSPAEQLDHALSGFLDWIVENREAYTRVMESVASLPEVRAIVEGVRQQTVERILGGLFPAGDAPPRARAAAHGWLWFMDGAIQDWLRHGDFSRDELKGVLVVTLGAAVTS